MVRTLTTVRAMTLRSKANERLCRVVRVKLYLLRYRQLVSSADLRPPCQAGNKHVYAGVGPQLDKLRLIEERRSRAHQTHRTNQDTPQLWQFVETGSSQNPSKSCDVACGILKEMGGNWRRIDAHRPKLGHLEQSIPLANAVRPVPRSAGPWKSVLPQAQSGPLEGKGRRFRPARQRHRPPSW